MTADPRDELAALDKTPPGWTRADTDAMLDAAWARALLSVARIRPGDEDSFFPLDRAEAERPTIQRGPLGQPVAWENIVAWPTQELP